VPKYAAEENNKMFEQSISGLIKSLRLVKNDSRGEERVVKQAMQEINEEVKSLDKEIKNDAIMKAIYVCENFQDQFIKSHLFS
jgi:hypothetical protein